MSLEFAVFVSSVGQKARLDNGIGDHSIEHHQELIADGLTRLLHVLLHLSLLKRLHLAVLEELLLLQMRSV